VKVHWLECFIIWSKNGPELCIVSIQSVYEDMERWKKKNGIWDIYQDLGLELFL
jgi:hypothetical protein